MTRLVNTLDISERMKGKFGCIEHSALNVRDNLLCLFIKLVRGVNSDDLSYFVKKCESNNVEDLVNLIIIWWETRANRLAGKGERSLFYDMIPSLIEVVGIEPILSTISLIPHFGYYKDFCYILEKNFDERLNEKIIDIYTKQLISDYKSFQKNEKISMAAKYAPSEKTHFQKIARIFAEKIFVDDKTCYKRYRKMKSELNQYLNLYHTKEFDEIHSIVSMPSLISKLSVYPFPDYEQDWYAQVNFVTRQIDKKVFQNALALIDVSDSMKGKEDVGIGLGLMVSELSETFHNRLLTFGNDYTWITLDAMQSIHEKIQYIKQEQKKGGRADLCKVMEKILSVCENLKLSSNEFPEVIFVFSDMQFTEANYNIRQNNGMLTHYESLKIRFKEAGERICGKPYNIPRIVFWNTKANSGGFQCVSSDNVQYFSGFDTCLFKYVNLHNNASQTLSHVLNDEKFLQIRHILSELKEGVFKDYEYCCEKDGFVIV